jgi:galactose oxidase
MNIGRAYQANTVLSSGDVFTLGGSWNGGIGNKHGELYSVAGNAWARLAGIPLPDTSDLIGPDVEGTYRGDNHMWLFAQSDGWVFQAGPSAQMHWIDTKNGGSVSAGIPRGDDAYSINGNAVLYDTGKILKLGGAANYSSGFAVGTSYLIDISKRPSVAVKRLAPLNFARSFANSVVLPSGEVVVVGGQSRLRLFYDDDAVQETELWDPRTQVFTKLNAPTAVARNYHSVALLLPDGRVLSGGGGLCGTNAMAAGCPGNHPDVQILTPPYLLNADGSPAARPVIRQAPTVMSAGQSALVDTDRPVSEWVLVRLSSTTHTVNNDQRRIRLSHVSQPARNRYQITIPADRGIALPGYWMLFALNAQGVPSVAKTLQIQ